MLKYLEDWKCHRPVSQYAAWQYLEGQYADKVYTAHQRSYYFQQFLSFANDGFFTVIRDPSELIEMQIEVTLIEATLILMVPEILISTDAEDSDHDVEFALADVNVHDSSDSDGG